MSAWWDHSSGNPRVSYGKRPEPPKPKWWQEVDWEGVLFAGCWGTILGCLIVLVCVVLPSWVASLFWSA